MSEDRKMKIAFFLLLNLLWCLSSFASVFAKETPELFPIGLYLKGYINCRGDTVIKPQFSAAYYFSEGLASVCVNDDANCGYIDATGKYVINPRFKFAGDFSEGLASVVIENKIGFIDKVGKITIKPLYDNNVSLDLSGRKFPIFSEGLASVRINGKYGFISKNGQTIIKPIYSSAFPFSEGLASVSINNQYGYINKTGKTSIKLQFSEAFPFVNGLAIVRINGKYGYIDKIGKVVIEPQFDEAFPFTEAGLATVYLGRKVGFINKQGKYVINPQYERPEGPRGIGRWEEKLPHHKEKKFSFSNQVAPVIIGNNAGYIDTNGDFLINPQFTYAQSFYGCLALVRTDSPSMKLFYIDKSGKQIGNSW